ncbi:DUF3566 domain-containing protein [bacterium]|nr:DUF3566 domain-containing protein [bacterium]MBU1984613.1 DUF3566 domain-containing protein [bacterium]
MKHEIRRIEPISGMRVGFLFGLLAGVVFWLIEIVLIKFLAGSGSQEILPPGAESLLELGGVSMVFMTVISSLLFSLIFAVLGGLSAVCYNFAARLFGGVEIHLDDTAEATDGTTRSEDPFDRDEDV